MYRCCIFDLDGTLVDSIHALTYTVNLTLKEFGMGPVTEDLIKIFVGDGAKMLVERALIHCGDEKLTHYDEAVELYKVLFRQHCLYRVDAYDGIRELLAFLKDRGIHTAVFSNKPHEQTLVNVESVFGKDSFDIVLGERESEGIKRKPDPAGAFYIAKTLGVKPEECLYFGDTNTDMKTGAAAGMDTVGVLWGFRDRTELEEYHPKYIISHPREIMEALAAIQ